MLGAGRCRRLAAVVLVLIDLMVLSSGYATAQPGAPQPVVTDVDPASAQAQALALAATVDLSAQLG